MTDPPLTSTSWRALCVDDETALREILALHLRRRNLAVETADDGLAAWELLSRDLGAIDLVITDNQMPRLNGVGLVRRLREANYPGKVIFFSSTLAANDAATVAALRVDAIVEKGTPVEHLLSAVDRVLGAGGVESAQK